MDIGSPISPTLLPVASSMSSSLLYSVPPAFLSENSLVLAFQRSWGFCCDLSSPALCNGHSQPSFREFDTVTAWPRHHFRIMEQAFSGPFIIASFMLKKLVSFCQLVTRLTLITVEVTNICLQGWPWRDISLDTFFFFFWEAVSLPVFSSQMNLHFTCWNFQWAVSCAQGTSPTVTAKN